MPNNTSTINLMPDCFLSVLKIHINDVFMKDDTFFKHKAAKILEGSLSVYVNIMLKTKCCYYWLITWGTEICSWCLKRLKVYDASAMTHLKTFCFANFPNYVLCILDVSYRIKIQQMADKCLVRILYWK